MFLPNILLPSRINNNSKTSIDNIFPNLIPNEVISGNLTTIMSDHLPQFLIAPDFSAIHQQKKMKLVKV